MGNPSVFLSLAARAEAGGDAELSDDVWRALGWECIAGWVWRNPARSGGGPRPDLCTSIDSHSALPGRIVDAHCGSHSDAQTDFYYATADGMCGAYCCAPTECLARLAALLRAMAQETQDGR